MFTQKLLLNTLCEFGPVLGFLIAFEMKDFNTGVITMIIAVICSLFLLKYTEDHIPFFALLSSASVLIFGGFSLIIDIPSIFILRDTLFDALFGITILFSVWINKPLFKILFRGVFAINDRGWKQLTFRWGIFFIVLAGINEWIRLTLSPEEWVTAKIYMIIASVLFGGYQFSLTRKERLPDATPWGIVR